MLLRGSAVKMPFPKRRFLPLLFVLVAKPVFSQEVSDTYQEWIDYRDGRVSMAFDQTPVELAVDAIRVQTGLQIVVPPAMRNKLLSLQLKQLPLEPAVRSFITNMGVRNFALMYDDDGRPNRAIVLSAISESSLGAVNARSAQGSESIAQPLTAKERETLQKDLKRWSELKQQERGQIEDRLKALPPSEEREQLIAEYGRQILGITSQGPSTP